MLVPFIDEIEELGGLADVLRGSENQEAPGFQGVVEEQYDLPLQDLVEIDQEVSAAHQIEPREGRVAGEVLAGEDAQIADRLRDLVVAIELDEEAPQPRARDLTGDVVEVQPCAGLVDGC